MPSNPLIKRSKPWKTCLFVFICGFLLYSNTISHEYAWDDKIVIEKNPRVQKGISGIPDLFTKYKSLNQYDQYGFRPITLSSFAMDYSLSKGNPHFSHFMNVFYNAVLSVLLFLFISTLFSGYHIAFSILVTLLYIAHPLHVEVVANIKSRDEIFGTLFSVVALYSFLKFLRTKKWGWVILTAVAYMLAYLSKENSITTLALIPLLFIIERVQISAKTIGAAVVSFAVLFVISMLIYQYTEKSTADANTTDGLGIYMENGILGNSFMFVGDIKTKIANAFYILLLYLKNFLVPYPLIYYYGYNIIPVTSWANPLVWISIILHAGIIAIGIKFIKQRPEILFGFLFYLVSISVYTHVLRTLSDTMADRFMFTASLGLCITLLGIIGWVFRVNWNEMVVKTDAASKGFSTWIRKNQKIAIPSLSILLIFSLLSFKRNTVWKDDMTLVKHDLPYMENSSRAHYYYASLLNKEISDHPNKVAKLEPEMIKHYRRSMEISDYAYLSYLDLGTYYCKTGRYDQGIPILRKGTQLFPEATDLHFFLGQTYVILNQNDSAVIYLEKSMTKSFNTPTNYYFLSIAYSRTNKLDKALVTANEGLQKFPDQKNMMYDALSHIYFNGGDLENSIAATFMRMQNGQQMADGYKDIIGRCYAMGKKELGDKYLEEARSKGIKFQ